MYVSLKNILQVVAGIKENAEIVAVDDSRVNICKS
jgi:hypothetical protein